MLPRRSANWGSRYSVTPPTDRFSTRLNGRRRGVRGWGDGVDVSLDQRGIADDDRVWRHVLGDHGAGANHGVRSDRMPGSQVAFAPIDAPRRTTSRERGGPLAAARKGIVGEGRVRPDEHVVFDGDPSQSCTPDLTVTRSPTTTSFSMKT